MQYMPGDERLMSLVVEGLEVLGVLGFPGVVVLGVYVDVALEFTGKVALWVPGKVVFLFPDVSMFTTLCEGTSFQK